ncbi:hypothetical protein DL96DRAFT_1682829 [Flagelloscypha sp. PMI_526]|nr:hypothetical protein DL96DRAFT_1682829 [Flagelloscypha sp. PMI_526]
MFYPALGMLGCSAVFRGIIVPPYFAHLSGVYSKQDSISTMVEASLFLAASCLMLYSVVAIRKTTHVDGESDPLRKVLMIAVPLWIIYELFRVVIAAFGIALVAIWVPIDISIMLFGLSSLTTILVLPGAIVGAESEKLEA